MKTTKSIITLSVLLLILFSTGCSRKDDVDRLLDKIENSIEKWEKIDPDNLTPDEVHQCTMDMQDIQYEAMKVKPMPEWKEEQKNRFIDLSARVEKISVKMSSRE